MPAGVVELAMRYVEHHPVLQLSTHGECDADAEGRITVDEVRRAVQRIHYPHMIRAWRAVRLLRLFAAYAMPWKGFEQCGHDGLLGGHIDLRHKVVQLLFAHLQRSRLRRRRADDAARSICSARRDCQDRMQLGQIDHARDGSAAPADTSCTMTSPWRRSFHSSRNSHTGSI